MVAWTGADRMTCTSGLPGGATTLKLSGSTYSGTFGVGTWKFFLRSSTGTCTLGGTVVVSTSGATYTLPFSTTSPPTVK